MTDGMTSDTPNTKRAIQQCKDAARLIDAAAGLLARARDAMPAPELREVRALADHYRQMLDRAADTVRTQRATLERKGAA
jgi:hypothetical protein